MQCNKWQRGGPLTSKHVLSELGADVDALCEGLQAVAETLKCFMIIAQVSGPLPACLMLPWSCLVVTSAPAGVSGIVRS